MEGRSSEELDQRLREFLAEDVGFADVTTDAIVPSDAVATAEIVAKSECVVSGLPVARRVFELLDPDLSWEERTPAGSKARTAPAPAKRPRSSSSPARRARCSVPSGSR